MNVFNRNQSPLGRFWSRQVVCQGGPTTIVFDSIPAGYTNARLSIHGACSSGGLIANWLMFNADATSGNYDSNQEVQGSNTSASAAIEATGANGITAGVFAGLGVDQTLVGAVDIFIPSYATRYFYKMFIATSIAYAGVGSLTNVRLQGGRWKNTDPITNIRLTVGSGTYRDGTTAMLTLSGD